MPVSAPAPGGPRFSAAAPLRAPQAASYKGRGVSRRSGVVVEANLFSRLARVIKATVDQFVGGFEDPEKLLDRVVQEMQEDTLKIRQASAQVMASQRQMQARQKSLQDSADQWLRRAELAVKQGADDLAREALRRRKVFQEDADRINIQVKAQQQASDQLAANLRTLESKVSEAKTKKETLKARTASAKTAMAIQDMVGGLRSSNSSSWSAFEKMEEKVQNLEAQAETAMAMSTPDGLEAKFLSLEGSGGVDDELAALKRGALAAPRQEQRQEQLYQPVAAGRPFNMAFDVDSELEELRRKARE